MADTVAREATDRVRAVDAVATLPLLQVGQHLGAGDVEKRPDHAIGTLRLDAAEAANARAANETMKHGLGLVVERVAGGDTAESLAGGDCEQCLIPRLARPLFEIRPSRDPRVDRVELAAETRGEARDEGLVAIGIAPAQVVVDVSDAHPPRPAIQLGQRGEERDGVWPTRYRHQHRVIRLEKRMAPDRACDLAENRVVHGRLQSPLARPRRQGWRLAGFAARRYFPSIVRVLLVVAAVERSGHCRGEPGAPGRPSTDAKRRRAPRGARADEAEPSEVRRGCRSSAGLAAYPRATG